MSATMQSQSILPRMQFGLSPGLAQRNHSSQILNDQMFGVGGMQQQQQQQQHGIQGGYGNMNLQTNTQNLQAGMVGLPNASQNPNFPQQRQQNQQ